ncbi:hypothetical protein [Lichenifustis flavocetrariae]|uniref:Uncharacterized protein n=1 Tax=Lichenifustis flavocetrariae TaxID=2949735 RepID=A0AA42CKW6_9HYPH|nr:hypothetical protein [Lichenifustis flavocetrariae]MCW6509721.1 hypothetical protein [Lichenifustis flavocetrariae]
MKTAAVMAVALVGASPVSAQQVEVGTGGVAKFGPVRQLLVDGYDIKTGFSDNNGGAYMILQKATSAYLCHSSPNQVCEKLN